jgi:hypothetical protein
MNADTSLSIYIGVYLYSSAVDYQTAGLGS